MYYDYYHYYPYYYRRHYPYPYFPDYPSYYTGVSQDIYNSGYMNDVWQYSNINNWANTPLNKRAASKKTFKRK